MPRPSASNPASALPVSRDPSVSPRAPIALVVAAFLSLYFFWGSTYLAIRFAIEPPEGFPPFFMAGIRNFVAGVILYILVRGRARFAAASRPTRRHWRNAAAVGTLLLLGGNGLVTFSEQFVPSGLVSLLIAMLPIWMALLERVWERPPPGAPARSRAASLGIALGFAGVVMLIGPKFLGVLQPVDAAPPLPNTTPSSTAPAGLWAAVGSFAVLVSSFCWANGSLLSRRANRRGGLPPSPFLSTAMQLVCGGVALLIVSGLTGEFPRVHLSSFTSIKPVLSVAYLITAGSLIGFTSYIWLLGVTTPSRVATYAYVNPIVAVWLGWWLAGESLTPLTLVAAAIVIAGVVLIVTFNKPAATKPVPFEKALDEEEELCGSVTQR